MSALLKVGCIKGKSRLKLARKIRVVTQLQAVKIKACRKEIGIQRNPLLPTLRSMVKACLNRTLGMQINSNSYPKMSHFKLFQSYQNRNEPIERSDLFHFDQYLSFE